MKKQHLSKVILSVVLVSTLIGCSSKAGWSEDSKSSTEYKTQVSDGSYGTEGAINKGEMAINPSSPNGDVATSNNSSIPESERKIIDRADVYIETLEFNEAITKLEDSIKTYGGYIESSNILQDGITGGEYKQNRSGEFIIRVPKEKFQNFLSDTGNIGVVTNKRTYGEDISSQYYDREGRLKVLKAQEERYLAILGNAKDVKEILEIEKSLTEIRYEIENITGYLKQMDGLVSYSTINLNIYEVLKTSVAEQTPKTFGEKIVKAFSDSLKSLKTVGTGVVLVLVAAVPYAIIFGVVGYVIFIIYKKYKIKK